MNGDIIKKVILVCTVVSLLLAVSACAIPNIPDDLPSSSIGNEGNEPGTQPAKPQDQPPPPPNPPPAYSTLVNRMTQAERDSVVVGDLTLLNRPDADKWTFDRGEMNAIKDSVREISIFDEEMIMTMIIHVTLPPNFDENKTYPALVMTDAVWRFGDHPALWKMMKNGEVKDVILVSIGYDFGVSGGSDEWRTFMFYKNKEMFLDFIIDNLMPLLDELYNIDFQNSTLFGHSAGGTFSHYAAFTSDLYENQPFHRYIIGSPAFWQIQYYDFNNQNELFRTEYGFFDRNQSFYKEIYITAGDNEDPYFEDLYGREESTIEGVNSFLKRMEQHGVTTVTAEFFWVGGHWEYVPKMLQNFMLIYYKAG